MIDWNSFVQWLFYGVVGGCAIYGCNIIAGMKNSIDTLNNNVGILLERTSNHEKRLDKLEDKI